MIMKNSWILVLIALFLFPVAKAKDGVNYPWRFNPTKGLVEEEEKGFREEICLNGTWAFMPVYDAKKEDFRLPGQFIWEKTPIKIPSPWNVNGFTDGRGGDFLAYPSYPEQWKKAQMGWMKKEVTIPHLWEGKRVKLHFEAVMGKAQIYVNGKLAGENFELFLPFDLDVTDLVRLGEKNEILVGVAKASLFDDRGKYGRRTYVGGSMWGIEMAGIWQDVFLLAHAPVYISDVFVQPDTEKKVLTVELELTNASAMNQQVNVEGEVRRWYSTAGRSLHEIPVASGGLEKEASLSFSGLKKVQVPAGKSVKVRLEQSAVNGLAYWTPDTPNLYGLVVRLSDKKQVLDKKQERFGWRTFRVDSDRLLLNGKPIQLKGDSWHFMGVPQMTRRYAWAWFNMLKDIHANAVRFHAQPYPGFYMDMADEMGICVLDETGIWSSDGGPKIDSEAYWDNCVEHIRRLVKRDKNHASVFGWSVCNETVPVAMHVFKAPEELIERQLKEINRWVKIVKEEDPTRSWISGDGETDRPTDLPTIVGHYGGMDGMKKWSSQGKPWGIGEQSMAYYGTPKQAAAYNGDRAYESMQGRMEAIAKESYGLMKTQRELNGSYCSVFNLAWYALKPLNLGMKDITRAPEPADGIYFGFEEGAYGMQPERLGPYTTTLNPGYDPSLPLYQAWPMLDAVRCANATPMQPCPTWQQEDKMIAFDKAASIDNVLVYASTTDLKEAMGALGVKVTSEGTATGRSLVVLDASHFPTDKQMLNNLHRNLSVKGVKVLILRLNKESLEQVNALLPYSVTLEDRKATSFLVEKTAAAMEGLGHADFYFSELMPNEHTAISSGMSGDFILKSQTLLRACPTDWQRWNYRAETSKTGNVYRSEREAKGADVVLSCLKQNGCEIYLSTLNLDEIRLETQPVASRLLTNIGVQISNDNISSMQALNNQFALQRALICGPTVQKELMKNSGYKPVLNEAYEGSVWQVATANADGSFSFTGKRGNKNHVVYVSFWVYSSRSLSDLLIEPDMPSMSMTVKANQETGFWLNGKQTELRSEGKETLQIPHIMLEKGWNHLVFRVANNEDTSTLGVRFQSEDQNFMKKILSQVVK